MSKILRTVALTAETMTAARISQATYRPIQRFIESIARVSGKHALRKGSIKPTPSSPHRVRRGRRTPIFAAFYAPRPVLGPVETTLARRGHKPSMANLPSLLLAALGHG